MGAASSTRRITIVDKNGGIIEFTNPVIERVDNAVGKEGESSKQHSDSNQPQVEQKREPHYEKFDKRDHYESSEKQSNFQQDAIHNEHFAKTVMPSTPPQFYDAALPSQPSQQPHSQGGQYVPMDMLRLRQQHQQELETMRQFNQSKVNMLEQQNKLLYNSAVKRLESSLGNVEEKYTRRLRHEPVCEMAEKDVESCYLKNPGMPLKCSKQAQDFINCIDNIRRQVL